MILVMTENKWSVQKQTFSKASANYAMKLVFQEWLGFFYVVTLKLFVSLHIKSDTSGESN